MKNIALALFMAGGANAAVKSYINNGDSWDATEGGNRACALGQSQSPIDLDTTLTSTVEDVFFKHYENVASDVHKNWDYGGADDAYYGMVKWKTGPSAIYANLADTGLGVLPTTEPVAPNFFNYPNYFTSSAGLDFDADETYYAKQLHFHTQSEHTIDGQLFDLEMHIVHQSPDGTVKDIDTEDQTIQDKKWPLGKLGVMGVIFDTNPEKHSAVTPAQEAAIDKFFDSLHMDRVFDNGKVIPDEIALGEMMSMLNTNNRWSYNGSLTTEPCYEYVYFNVLKNVYPIKQHHFDYYNYVIQRRADELSYAKENGNYRKARPAGPLHAVKLVDAPAGYRNIREPFVQNPDALQNSFDNNAALAMMVIVCLVVLVVLILSIRLSLLSLELSKKSTKQIQLVTTRSSLYEQTGVDTERSIPDQPSPSPSPQKQNEIN